MTVTIKTMTLQQMRDKIHEQELPDLERLAATGDEDAIKMLRAERRRRGMDEDTGIITKEQLLREMPLDSLKAAWAKESAEAARVERQQALTGQVATTFVVSQPLFEANPKNGKILLDYMLEHTELPATPDGLDEAFHTLVASGQLKAKHTVQPIKLKSQLTPQEMSADELLERSGGYHLESYTERRRY